jgi:hypothetical protein
MPEIAACQIHALRKYQRLRERPIKLHEVKEMSRAMRNEPQVPFERSASPTRRFIMTVDQL